VPAEEGFGGAEAMDSGAASARESVVGGCVDAVPAAASCMRASVSLSPTAVAD